MPRPTNKAELVALSDKNYDRLVTFIDSFSEAEQQQEFPEGTLNRNIRDVLAHLYEWHGMMKRWYEVGMLGEKPNIPAEGFTWKTLPELNKNIQQKFSNMKLSEAKKRFENSHKEIMKLIKKHSDVELFTKKKYHWTGTTSLGAYFISNTSSHYDWAYKLIKKATRNRN
ncbi:ClbS/DfsB family four-helix bundle protein [Flavobacteriaceae bacterium TK19130]|nr:ClbS/DfsB family four-helix bundle protein [Thermobacterium salinum]